MKDPFALRKTTPIESLEKGDICPVPNNVNNHAYMNILHCIYIKWNLGLLTMEN